MTYELCKLDRKFYVRQSSSLPDWQFPHSALAYRHCLSSRKSFLNKVSLPSTKWHLLGGSLTYFEPVYYTSFLVTQKHLGFLHKNKVAILASTIGTLAVVACGTNTESRLLQLSDSTYKNTIEKPTVLQIVVTWLWVIAL